MRQASPRAASIMRKAIAKFPLMDEHEDFFESLSIDFGNSERLGKELAFLHQKARRSLLRIY
jgi:hypothetical protein